MVCIEIMEKATKTRDRHKLRFPCRIVLLKCIKTKGVSMPIAQRRSINTCYFRPILYLFPCFFICKYCFIVII